MVFDFNQNIVLENEIVRLEPLDMRHMPQLLEISLEENLLQYSPRQLGTKEKLEEYIEAALAERQQQLRYPFAVYDKSTGQWAGSTSFGNVSSPDKRLEIGWTWYGKDFRRTGLNRQCKLLLLKYIFEELNWERAELRTDERNLASRTAIEKLGAVYEGTLRSHIQMPDGFRRTTRCYSIIKSEWPQVKERLLKDYQLQK